MNQYRKQVKPKNRYREFVRVLNGALQLTERESAVLAQLMQLDAEWPEGQLEYKNIISTDSRRYIMDETLINKSNLTKYIALFKQHGIILMDEEGRGYINPLFKAQDIDGKFKVLFVLDFTNNQDKNE